MKLAKLNPLFLIVLIIIFSGCSFLQNCEDGEGQILELELDVESFSKLKVSNSVTVFLEQSQQQKVTIKAQDNLIKLLNTKVSRDTWNIKFNKCVKPKDQIEIHIQTRELDEININGSGSVIGKSIFSNDVLELSINGSGSIDLRVAVKELISDISGSGSIQLIGNTKTHEIEVDGSGDILALDLISDETEVEINGSGDVKVNTFYALDVEINGSGDVYYKGNVKQISSDINGSGSLNQEK